MAISHSGDLRQSVRTSMFVAATLRTRGATIPVRVRNMSTKGALVEGALLPPVGTTVELIRGPLVAMGSVAWCEAGRCGLALAGAVDTQAWMSRHTPSHQAEVDQRLAEARAAIEQAPPATVSIAEPPPGFDRMQSLPQQEILLLIAKLEGLGEQLAGDMAVVARHGATLQIIDEVQQRLQALSRRLG